MCTNRFHRAFFLSFLQSCSSAVRVIFTFPFFPRKSLRFSQCQLNEWKEKKEGVGRIWRERGKDTQRERGSVGRRRVKRRKKENKEQRAILNAYHSAM